MDLPEHVSTALGVASSITEDELAANGSVGQFALEVFGLSAADLASEAAETLGQQHACTVLQARQPPEKWLSLEIRLEDTTRVIGVCTPRPDAGAPPTDIGRALVGAWIAKEEIVNDKVVEAGLFVETRRGVLERSDFPSRCIGEWAKACALLENADRPPVWLGNSLVQIGSGARILAGQPNMQFHDVFVEILSEVKPKWRFISLYRVFEHGYLELLFNKFRDGFFTAPRESAESLRSALDSEQAQFLELVREAKLEPHFDAIYGGFASLENSNRFAATIGRVLKSRGSGAELAKSRAEKAVAMCYQVRCAIVHAGSAAPVFEKFPDAPALLEAVLPDFERAVLEFVGMDLV